MAENSSAEWVRRGAVPAVWNGDRSVPLREISIGEFVRAAAMRAPDSPALVSGIESNGWPQRRWTYGELWRDVQAVAAALLTRFAPGERVAISAANGPEWELVELGACTAGMTLIPLNTSLAASEVEYILRQSRAAGIVIGPGSIGAQIDSLRGALPDLREILDISPGSALWSVSAAEITLPSPSPDSPALIQYTSGTTGAPKGVVITHSAAINNGSLSAHRLDLPSGGVWLNPLPMYHVNGTIFFALGAISKVASHVIAKFDPGVVLDLIKRERVTYFTGVPTLLNAMMSRADFDRRDLSGLRRITTGGTSIAPKLVEDIRHRFGAEVMVMFGQTEVAGAITMTSPTDDVETISTTVGRPLAWTDVKIAAVGTDTAVTHGAVGEICVRGATVFREYFEMPEATASAFDAEGWLRTGDLGTMAEDGSIQVTGRLKEMIIRGGENIYPRDVEDVLIGHPDIADVAVVGLPDDYYGEIVTAVLKLRPGAAVDAADWMAFAADQLSRRKVPARWFVVDELPLTPSGKVQKFRVREQILNDLATPVPAPESMPK